MGDELQQFLPREPMAPISHAELPEGADWGFQIKWDGVRLLSTIQPDKVMLYSRKLLLKNAVYPEIAAALSTNVQQKRIILDGEAIVFNAERHQPDFQKILQRERLSGRRSASADSISYVLFDLLYYGSEDLRKRPFQYRYEMLQSLFPQPSEQLFATDLFMDGQALWEWVDKHQWEGVVSKRLSSSYLEGKKHQDWLKKKKSLHMVMTVPGVVWRNGQPASLIMLHQGQYAGRVSLGLTVNQKKLVAHYAAEHRADVMQPLYSASHAVTGKLSQLHSMPADAMAAPLPLHFMQEDVMAVPPLHPLSKDITAAHIPFFPIPADLKREEVRWLSKPLYCEITGLEHTSAGLIRHPKLLRLWQASPQ
ncbi:MAG: hypothetical protein A2189_02235 [Paenibacillus sp. RIFOXYA1_FULL_44_5]|nr:MAG: hypothetical protein A2189_02235 [Paenibacillus sp. RIFOXYA1_FULL_44_5]